MAKTYSIECSVCGQEIEYKHKSKPNVCPNCNNLYWDKPTDERELFLLQDRYFQNGRRQEDLGLIYLKVLEYAKNIIKNKLKGKVFLSKEDFEDKANKIAIKVIEGYLRSESNRVDNSFGGIIGWIANGELFSARKEDQTESLNNTIFDSQNEMITTLSEVSNVTTSSDYSSDPQNNLSYYSQENLLKELRNLLDGIYNRVYEYRSSQNLLFLLGIDHFLSSKKNIFIREFNSIISNQTKRDIEKTKLVMRNYLIERRQS